MPARAQIIPTELRVDGATCVPSSFGGTAHPFARRARQNELPVAARRFAFCFAAVGNFEWHRLCNLRVLH
jgi:hypothetical protein